MLTYSKDGCLPHSTQMARLTGEAGKAMWEEHFASILNVVSVALNVKNRKPTLKWVTWNPGSTSYLYGLCYSILLNNITIFYLCAI